MFLSDIAAGMNAAIVFYRKSSNPLILMACFNDPRRRLLQNWKPGKSTQHFAFEEISWMWAVF